MMKRICLMVMGIMVLSGTGFGTETNGIVKNEIVFETVEGVPLTFNEMSEIEGAGYRNAIARSFWDAIISGFLTTLTGYGLSLFVSEPYKTIIIPSPLSITFQSVMGGFSGWIRGKKINDTDDPVYRRIGFAWLDHEMFDWIPEEESVLSNESVTNQTRVENEK